MDVLIWVVLVLMWMSIIELHRAIKNLYEFRELQNELDKQLSESLKTSGDFITQIAEVLKKHLKDEAEIFEQLGKDIKDKGEDDNGTLY